MMKLLEVIQNCKIEASGGFAIYVALCVLYVTIAGLIEFIQFITKWIK